MMSWIVHLRNGSKYEFVDLLQAKGQYYQLQTGWIRKLQKRIKEQSTYSVHTNLIASTKGPESESLQAPFLLVLVTKTTLTVSFLGELTDEETGYIVGIWPDTFLQVLKSDEEAILNLLYIITNQPELVDRIELHF